MNRKSSIPVAGGDGGAAMMLFLGAAIVLFLLSSFTTDAQINNIFCCRTCETVADVCYANCTANGVLVPTSACVAACGQNYNSCAAPCGTCALAESVFCCQDCRLKNQICYDNCVVQGSGSAQPGCVYDNCVTTYASCTDACPGRCI